MVTAAIYVYLCQQECNHGKTHALQHTADARPQEVAEAENQVQQIPSDDQGASSLARAWIQDLNMVDPFASDHPHSQVRVNFSCGPRGNADHSKSHTDDILCDNEILLQHSHDIS